MASELSYALKRCRKFVVSIGLLSGASNILALTGSIFMLTVYDRVIPSGSVPTLVSLGLIAAAMYGFQAFLDILRGRMLTRIGLSIQESFSPRIYDVIVRNSFGGDHSSAGAIRDIDQVRGFLSSLGPTALFDLPWLFIYLAICFAFHVYIGLSVVAGALLLILLTFLTDRMTKSLSSNVTSAVTARQNYIGACQSNAETLNAMGMTLAMSGKWKNIEDRIMADSQGLSDISTTLGTISKTVRMMLQSFVLAVGAYLVIKQEATGGIMIASSILSSRALSPIELTIAHWKGFIATKASWKRLDQQLVANPPERSRLPSLRPSEIIECRKVSLTAPNVRRLLVRDVSFSLKAGEVLGIIGPTGSGKSTLARSLVGLLTPVVGDIRLDGVLMSQWPSTARGRFVGYLPQAVGLFEGTIAENIARFEPGAEMSRVMKAADTAGAHDLIMKLPNGYETLIGQNGMGLSGGQNQRVGLARALYDDPFLIVLDEPNSALDGDGEEALIKAMEAAKSRGAIVVIVAHRPAVLSPATHILVMNDGTSQRFGRRDEVMDLGSRVVPMSSILNR